MKGDARTDPKGLIEEAYRMPDVTASECRSIFLDWALSLPEGSDTRAILRQLIDRFATAQPEHPMTQVMQEGLTSVATPKRRGGWRARPRT